MNIKEAIHEVLKFKNKVIFSSYIHNSTPGVNSIFYYVNESPFLEKVSVFFLDAVGLSPKGFQPLAISLGPNESLHVDIAAEIKKINGSVQFFGNIYIVVYDPDESHNMESTKKDLVSLWQSDVACVQIGIAALASFNESSKKGPKTYLMFCPAVHETKETTTKVVLFNSSTESGYNDRVEIIPKLHNLNGETILGKALFIEPFCAGVLNVGDHFGATGAELLEKTGGRGSLTIMHNGHTFSSYFFFEDKSSGVLFSGRHTQPPVLTLFRQPKYNVLAEWLGARLPFFGKIIPALSFLKHNPDTLATFYPHHSNYLNSWWDWFKQSRYVIYTRMILRAAFFLLKRGFIIEEFKEVSAENQLNTHVIDHNLWNNLKLFQFSRARIESLLYPMLSISSVNKNGKTLCIGPKNEGEILLIESHGFKDVVGIDLFTYSPKISVMDMHKMSLSTSQFDTIFCGWVIKYSYDIHKAISEIVRVSKDGAIIICSFAVTLPGKEAGSLGEIDFLLTHLKGGISELLSLFDPHVAHVYYWSEDIVQDRCRNCIVIFKLQKNGAAASVQLNKIVEYNKLP